jgi:hypothetical protein
VAAFDSEFDAITIGDEPAEPAAELSDAELLAADQARVPTPTEPNHEGVAADLLEDFVVPKTVDIPIETPVEPEANEPAETPTLQAEPAPAPVELADAEDNAELLEATLAEFEAEEAVGTPHKRDPMAFLRLARAKKAQIDAEEAAKKAQRDADYEARLDKMREEQRAAYRLARPRSAKTIVHDEKRNAAIAAAEAKLGRPLDCDERQRLMWKENQRARRERLAKETAPVVPAELEVLLPEPEIEARTYDVDAFAAPLRAWLAGNSRKATALRGQEEDLIEALRALLKARDELGVDPGYGTFARYLTTGLGRRVEKREAQQKLGHLRYFQEYVWRADELQKILRCTMKK